MLTIGKSNENKIFVYQQRRKMKKENKKKKMISLIGLLLTHTAYIETLLWRRPRCQEINKQWPVYPIYLDLPINIYICIHIFYDHIINF